MRRIRSALLSVSLAALAGAMVAMMVVPAQAATPRSHLVLSIYRGETADAGALLARVTLTCNPDGGTHPHPDQACDALRSVHGHIENLPGDPGVCPFIFA